MWWSKLNTILKDSAGEDDFWAAQSEYSTPLCTQGFAESDLINMVLYYFKAKTKDVYSECNSVYRVKRGCPLQCVHKHKQCALEKIKPKN